MHFSYITVAVAVTTVLVSHTVQAWGHTGHHITGALAETLVSQKTHIILTKLFKQYNGTDLNKVAAWADEVKSRSSYTWSNKLHYVATQDNPSTNCSFNQQRDCANGHCLTAAIANYTTRLSCRQSKTQRTEAVKFLVHFLGDLTQPLHVCGRKKGGTQAYVNFSKNHSQSLHSLWDSTMIEVRMKKDFNGNFTSYMTYLKSELKSTAAASINLWKACMTQSVSVLNCVISWAKEDDALNCSAVWGEVDANPNADLSLSYYEKMIKIIEKQLMKAAVRIAALLNTKLVSC